jgi:AraC-like DNA-binding protein
VIPGVSAPELEDRIVALDAVWGVEAHLLSQDLEALQGETARIACLESALVQWMARRMTAQRREPSVDIPGVAAWIVASGGQVTVESLAESAGLSRQHFTRAFRESVGVSPKTYCQLARCQSTLAYVRRGDDVEWAQVAAESGYADQSHMIAEFRRFTGLTPEALHKGRWFHPFIERRARR